MFTMFGLCVTIVLTIFFHLILMILSELGILVFTFQITKRSAKKLNCLEVISG